MPPRRSETDWLGLESRLRQILRDFRAVPESLTNALVAVHQVDAALGAYTGRGEELPEHTADRELDADIYHTRKWELDLQRIRQLEWELQRVKEEKRIRDRRI